MRTRTFCVGRQNQAGGLDWSRQSKHLAQAGGAGKLVFMEKDGPRGQGSGPSLLFLTRQPPR